MEKNKTPESLTSINRIIAIGSCKGGVGKTTVCVNLALSLAKSGFQVAVFDADLYGPNVPVMLGERRDKNLFPYQTSQKGKTMQFIPIARTDTKPYIKPLKKYGLSVMSLGLWFSDTFNVTDSSSLEAHMVRQTLFDVIWGEKDFLLIDLPPGTGSIQKLLLRTVPLDGLALVVTPQDLALQDTSRALQFYNKMEVRIIGVVENMSYTVCPKCEHKFELFQKQYSDWPVLTDFPMLGAIPLDKQLGSIISDEHPLLKKDETSYSKIFHKIMSEIEKRLEQ